MDLTAIITKNYDRETKTLNLDGVVRGGDLFNVLKKIKVCKLNNQIEYLSMKNNNFGNSFDSASMRPGPAGQIFQVPSNLKDLDLSNNYLSGSLFPWHFLPQTLQSLHLQNNHFEGKIDWSLLPRQLKVLWIFGNDFVPSFEWHMLPVYLNEFATSKIMAVTAFPPPAEWMKEMVDDEHKVVFTKSIIR